MSYSPQKTDDSEQQPPAYSPPPVYSQPTDYNQIQVTYRQPQVTYGQPQVTYGQPQVAYGQPTTGYGQTIQMQPMGQATVVQSLPLDAQWLIIPGSIPGCPPGLERLTLVDKLIVKQKVTLLEAITAWEQRNSYDIKNEAGMQLYFASEESNLCMRQCCGNKRGFVIHILDNVGQEVIRVRREFKCCANQNCECFACFACCAHEVEVESPPGNLVGFIRQRCSCWVPRFDVLDAQRETILKIDGPCCMCQTICCRCDIDFTVNSRDGEHEVGKVSKKWSGILNEMFTMADTFGVSFPMDLDVKMKAVMIGAVFLIDFMYFEIESRDT